MRINEADEKEKMILNTTDGVGEEEAVMLLYSIAGLAE